MADPTGTSPAQPPPGDDAPAATPFSLRDHRPLKMLRNTAALAVGRNLNALMRLVIASLVVRSMGAEAFGVYSVVVALLAIADWLLDFGTTDVFVRELVKEPARYRQLRQCLVALKLIQTPVSMALMCLALVSIEYSGEILTAGLIAVASLVFFWAVAVYRSIFKATLTMEREMIAEFVSVLVMVPLVLATIQFELGTAGLMWSLVLSRAVFLSGCAILAGGERPLDFRGASYVDVRWLARSSFVIGVIGLLIVINNSLEMILLSRLSTLSDVAFFSASQKLVMPFFMVLTALGVSYYPVLAAEFPRDRSRFRKSCQQLFDLTSIGGGAAICGVYCGAEFLLSLLGEELLPAAPALRLLIVAYVVKSIGGVIGPTLFIVGAQNQAIRYYSVALIIKTAAIVWLAPTYGFLGAAAVSFAGEVLFVVPVTLYYVWRLTGFRPNLSKMAPVVLVTGGSIFAASLVFPSGSFLCAALAVLIYGVLVFTLRIIRIDAVRRLLRKAEG